MGKNNAKLCEMSVFRRSIQSKMPALLAMENIRLTTIRPEQLDSLAEWLWDIIADLQVGVGAVKIVSGSKAFHHLLPELVPPVDREYTLRFFFGNKNVTSDNQNAKFLDIFKAYVFVANSRWESIAEAMRRGGEMNTSTTKVIDNAIIGCVLRHRMNQPPEVGIAPPPQKPLPAIPPSSEPGETHAAQIMRASGALVKAGYQTFTRDDVRSYLQLSPNEWLNGYTAIFQGMRIDQPGARPRSRRNTGVCSGGYVVGFTRLPPMGLAYSQEKQIEVCE